MGGLALTGACRRDLWACSVTALEQCRRNNMPGVRVRSCVEQLAEGWILPPDLCPACTQAFMTALDGIDRPLTWHENYLARAER